MTGVENAPAHNRGLDFGAPQEGGSVTEARRRSGVSLPVRQSDVAVEQDEVGEHAGLDETLLVFLECRVRSCIVEEGWDEGDDESGTGLIPTKSCNPSVRGTVRRVSPQGLLDGDPLLGHPTVEWKTGDLLRGNEPLIVMG